MVSPPGKKISQRGGASEEREYRLRLLRRLSPGMGQILRQARAAGLKTQFMGRKAWLTSRCLTLRANQRKGYGDQAEELRSGSGEQTHC